VRVCLLASVEGGGRREEGGEPLMDAPRGTW
jgi:hypothetical protein